MPNELKNARDYEEHLGEGVVRIFEGHPCYCPVQERHAPHNFVYDRIDNNGEISHGRYDCDGIPMMFASGEATRYGAERTDDA